MNAKDEKEEFGKYASFWERTIAYNIDFTLLISFFFFIRLFLDNERFIFILCAVLAICYEVFLVQSTWAGTLGKKIVKLKVVDKNNAKLSLTKTIIRTVLKVITIPFLFLTLLMVTYRKDHRAIHDWAVNAFVIKTN